MQAIKYAPAAPSRQALFSVCSGTRHNADAGIILRCDVQDCCSQPSQHYTNFWYNPIESAAVSADRLRTATHPSTALVKTEVATHHGLQWACRGLRDPTPATAHEHEIALFPSVWPLVLLAPLQKEKKRRQ
eukprot:1150012-Pelagomonas_calceolata.AAC.4